MMLGSSLGNAVGFVSLDTSGVNSGVDNTMSQLQRLDQVGSGNLSSLEKSINGVGLTTRQVGLGFTAFGAALLAPIAVGVKGAMNLEQAFVDVQASMDKMDYGRMDEVKDMIIDIGASGQFSAGEIAAVTEELVKSGFSIDQILSGDPAKGFGNMAQAVSDLASATGSGLGPAVEGISAAMNIWHPNIVDSSIALTDAARAADIFTVAANASSADTSDIIDGMRNFGPVAAGLGISFEDAAGSIAYFTNYGLKARVAGTALSTAMQRLAAPTGKAADTMRDLGISAWDSQGSFIGMPALFTQLRDRMSGMSDEAKMAALTTIFGAEAMDVMGIAVLEGADGLGKITAQMNDYGIAGRQAEMRTKTLQGAIERLQEGFYTMLAVLASGLTGPLTMLANGLDKITAAIMKLPDWVLKAIGLFIALAGASAVAAGSFLLFAPRIREFMAGMRALSMMTGPLGGVARVFMALVRFTGPFARLAQAILSVATASRFMTMALGGIVGLGIFAYQSNVLGFGDWVDDQVAKALRAWDKFKSIFGASDNQDLGQRKFQESPFEGSIMSEAGSGADGKDWFVLGKDGEKIGQILESKAFEDGSIEMKVQFDDGTQQWLTQGPDGTTEWSDRTDGIKETGKAAESARTPLQRFNDGIDSLQRSLDRRGLGMFNPLLEGFQDVATLGATGLGKAKKFGGWLSDFNKEFVEDRRRWKGVAGVDQTFGDSLATAWRVTRPYSGFWRDFGDKLFTNKDANGVGISVADRISGAVGLALGAVGLEGAVPFTDGLIHGVGKVVGGAGKFASTLKDMWDLNRVKGIGMGGAGKRGVGPLYTGMGIQEAGKWERAYSTLAGTFRVMGWGDQADAIERFGEKVQIGLDAGGRALDKAQQRFGGFVNGFRKNWNFFSKAAPDMAFGEKLARSISGGLRAMGLEGVSNWMDKHARSIGLVGKAVAAGLLTLTSGTALAAAATTAFLTGVSFLPNILDKVADGLEFLGMDGFAKTVRGWADNVRGFHDQLMNAAYAGVFLRQALGRAAIIGIAAVTNMGRAAINAAPKVAEFGRTWIQFFASGKILDWIGQNITWGNIDNALEQAFGKGFEFALNLTLDLVIKFFEEPGTQVRNMVIASIAASFAVLTVTGGISAALVLLGIVGLAALVVYVVKKVVDYFRGSKEARAEVSMKIGIIWGNLEQIPILGPIFTFGRLLYTYLLKPLAQAGLAIRNWMHEQGGIFERMAEMAERSWLAMAGLNLLEKFGASAVLGKYTKQVASATQDGKMMTRSVEGLEAAMYGLFKLMKLPFEFTFRPLDLLKQVTGGTDARILNSIMKKTIGDLSDLTLEEALRIRNPEVRALMNLPEHMNGEMRVANRLGAAFVDSLRIAREVIKSFFSPIGTIVNRWKALAGFVRSYNTYLANLTGLSRQLSAFKLFDMTATPKQIGEVIDMYKFFVGKYGDIDITRIFNEDVVHADKELQSLRGLTKGVRDEYAKIFKFLAKNEGSASILPKFSPKRIVLWVVAFEQAISNALRRRGGIARAIQFAFLQAPIEFPAKVFSKILNLDSWLKGGLKGGDFAKGIREWWNTAIDPEAMNFSKRGKLINQELNKMMRDIQRNPQLQPAIKKLGDEFYADWNKAFDYKNFTGSAHANIADLRAFLLDEIQSVVDLPGGRFEKLRDAVNDINAGLGRPGGSLGKTLDSLTDKQLVNAFDSFEKATDDVIDIVNRGFSNIDDMAKINKGIGQKFLGWIDRSILRFPRAIRTFIGDAIDAQRTLLGFMRAWVGQIGDIDNIMRDTMSGRKALAARAIESIADELFATGRITNRAIQVGIGNIFKNIDFNQPVDDIVRDLNTSLGRLRGVKKVDLSALEDIVTREFAFRGSRMQRAFARIFGSLFSPTVFFVDPKVMAVGGMFENMFRGFGRTFTSTAELAARFGRGMSRLATGPLRFIGQQVGNLGRNFNTTANVFAKVFPWFDRFGSAGPRVALGLTLAAIASALWAKNLFGLKDAFGGVVYAIGDGLGAIRKAYGKDGIGGVIELIEDGLQKALSDIPGTLNAIADSPAWGKLFRIFAIFGGMFVGGLPGLVIGLAAPWIADFATGVMGAIADITAAYKDSPLGGSIQGLAGSGPDGMNWFVLDKDGEKVGKILESYHDADGKLQLKVQMDDGSVEWMTQGEDGTIDYSDHSKEARANRERKTWLNTFEDAARSASKVAKGFGRSMLGIGEAVEDWPIIGPGLSKVFNGIGNAALDLGNRFENMAISFRNSIRKGTPFGKATLKAITTAFPEIDTFIGKISGMWGRISVGAAPFLNQIAAIGRSIMDLGAPIGEILGGFGKIFSGDFMAGFSQIGSGLRNLAIGVGDVALQFLQLGRMGISQLFSSLIGKFPALSKGFNMMSRGLQLALSGAMGVVRGFQEILKGNFSEGFTQIGRSIQNIFSGIGLAFQGALNMLQQVDWGAVGQSILNAFHAAWPNITATVDFIVNILGKIGEAFWSAYQTASEWLISGIPGAAGWIADFLGGGGATIQAGDVTMEVGIKGSLIDAIKEGTVEEWLKNNAALLGAGAVTVALLAGVSIPIVGAAAIISVAIIPQVVDGIKEEGFWPWIKNNWESLGVSAVVGALLIGGPPAALAVGAAVVLVALGIKAVDAIKEGTFWEFLKANGPAIGLSAVTLALLIGGPPAALAVGAAFILVALGMKISDMIGDQGFWEFVKKNWAAIGIGLTLGALIVGGPLAGLAVGAAVISLPIVIDLIGDAVNWAGTAWDWIKDHSPGWVQDIMNGIENFVAPEATVETPLQVKPMEQLMPIEEDDVWEDSVQGFGNISMVRGGRPMAGGGRPIAPALDTSQLSASILLAQGLYDALKTNTATRLTELAATVRSTYGGMAAGLPPVVGGMGSAIAAIYSALGGQVSSTNQQVSTGTTTAYGGMATTIPPMVTGMQSRIGGAFAGIAADGARQSAVTATSWLSGTGTMATGATGATAGMFGGMSGSFAGIAGSARTQTGIMSSTAIGNAASMAAGGISSAGQMNSGMTGKIAGIVGYIAGQTAAWAWTTIAAGGALYGAGSSAGYQLGRGIAAGIDASAALVSAAAARLIAIATTAAAIAAAIHSPSRLWRDKIGINLGLGAAEGIVNPVALRAISHSTQELMEFATDHADDYRPGSRATIARDYAYGDRSAPPSGGQTVINNWVTVPPDAWERLNTRVARSARFVDDWTRDDRAAAYIGE